MIDRFIKKCKTNDAVRAQKETRACAAVGGHTRTSSPLIGEGEMPRMRSNMCGTTRASSCGCVGSGMMCQGCALNIVVGGMAAQHPDCPPRPPLERGVLMVLAPSVWQVCSEDDEEPLTPSATQGPGSASPLKCDGGERLRSAMQGPESLSPLEMRCERLFFTCDGVERLKSALQGGESASERQMTVEQRLERLLLKCDGLERLCDEEKPLVEETPLLDAEEQKRQGERAAKKAQKNKARKVRKKLAALRDANSIAY